MTAPTVTQGRLAAFYKVGLYGPEGVGKTTFASGAPDPLVIDLDRGSYEVSVSRTEPSTFEEVLEAIEWGAHAPSVGSIVLDSASSLERLIIERVIRGTQATSLVDKVGDYDGTFGRGDVMALQRWREVIGALDRAARSRHIIIIGHSVVKRVDAPTGESFDRYEWALRPGPAAEIKRWVNYLLFARAEISVRKNERTKHGIAEDLRTRTIYTDCSGAYEAKHRGSLPAQLPLSWAAFAAAVEADRVPPEQQQAIIRDLLRDVTDEAVRAKAEAAAAEAVGNGPRLAVISDRLRAVIKSQEAK